MPSLVAEGADDWWGGVPRVEHFSIRASLASSGSRDGRRVKEGGVLFVGLDWAEGHHDVVVMDELGGVAARQRVTEGWPG